MKQTMSEVNVKAYSERIKALAYFRFGHKILNT